MKKVADNSKKTIILVVFIVFCAVPVAVILGVSFNHHHKQEQHPSLLEKTCSKTLYPSLCRTTLSYPVAIKKATRPHDILQMSIKYALKSIKKSRSDILNIILTGQVLNSLEKNALYDCIEMLQQTHYELRQALHKTQQSDDLGFGSTLAGNLKTLLSAAMTNENTCIDGLSDIEEADQESQSHMGLKEKLQKILTPISQMISNCLAMVKHLETSTSHTRSHSRKYSITKMPFSFSFPDWMSYGERKLMEAAPEIKPNVIVAADGSGKFMTIGEALRIAPKMSSKRFVIKIKTGVYMENVFISREMKNIILIGDGMTSTFIIGCRNFVDGFSTFNSATLIVSGHKFLARDLTVINTSSPEKHQAVAVRVTSDSAFYRCNFSSYQDTLYAHSFRQLYRECTIQGTVDFIFGNAAAVFQNCLILARRPIPGQKNMITAQGRDDPHQNTGFSLQNCTILAAPDLLKATWLDPSSTFLGRPWRNHSRVMVMKCYVGKLIHPRGWQKWNSYSTVDTVEYIECWNSGPGSYTGGRVTWGGYKRNCSEVLAQEFTVGKFLHEADYWLGSPGFPFLYDP